MPLPASARARVTAALSLFLLTAATSASAAIRVAVEQGAGNQSTGAAVVAQLNNDTFFDFTATLVTAGQLDSAAELANYDVVVFGDSGHNDNDWTPAMAAAIRAAVNAGTLGVVSTGWADYGTGNGGDPTRDTHLDDVMPIDAYPFHYGFCTGPQTISFSNTTHPVSAGVGTFTTNASNVEGSTTAPDATGGAVLGAACGRNMVVVGSYGSGRIVYLGLLYMASSGYNLTDLRTGAADRLLEQAVSWAVPNLPPIADAKSVTTNEDTPVSFTLTGSDPEGKPITFALASPPTKGTLSGTAPNLTYTPNPNANGTDSFTFTTSDGQRTSAPGVVTLTVQPVNDAPVAQALSLTTAEDVAKAFTLVGTDVDGQPLTFALVSSPAQGGISGTLPNGTYTPAPDFHGADSFTFTVSDGTATSAPATVSITVTPVNDAPHATAQTLTTDEDVPLAVTLGGTDADQDPLTFTVTAPPANGVLTGTAPNLTYTPNPNFHGTDSFVFTVSDGSATSAPAMISLTVNPVNDAPAAANQLVTVAEDGLVSITLSAVDVDGDPLTWAIDTAPTSGSLSGTAPAVDYAPNNDFFGPDSFTFTVSDGVAVGTGTITVDVTPVNDPPVALDQTVEVDQGKGTQLTLMATDVDGDPLTFVIMSSPTHGVITGMGPQVTYTPDTQYRGPDSFTYVVEDGQSASAAATVSVTVKNLPPVLTVMASASTPLQGEVVQFTSMALDPGGEPVTVSWDFGDGQQATGPSASHAWSALGEFTITATASDGELTTEQTLTVLVQNGTPIISGIQGPEMGDEGAALAFAADAMDPGGDALVYLWSWGDDSAPTEGATASHTWGDDGSYQLVLTVTDANGQSSTSTRTVTIKNLPPLSTLPPEQTATVGQPVTLQLTATDPAGQRDPLSWTLISGVGTVSPTGEWTWTPGEEQPGRFTVIARVSDDDEGATDVPFAVNLQADPNALPTGCGCAAGAGSLGGGWMGFGLALVAALRARRRTRR